MYPFENIITPFVDTLTNLETTCTQAESDFNAVIILAIFIIAEPILYTLKKAFF